MRSAHRIGRKNLVDRNRTRTALEAATSPCLEQLEQRRLLAVALSLNPIDDVDENGIATLSGSVSGLQANNNFTLDVNWGDALSPNNTQQFVLTATAGGTKTFSFTHKYLDDNPTATAQDTYNVKVDLTEAPLLIGADAVFVIDVSGSTTAGFGGTAVGDLNGDGQFNTILDAEIAGFIALNQNLIDRGLGSTAKVSIVSFQSTGVQRDMNAVAGGLQLFCTPLADANSNGRRDVDDVLRSMVAGGGTNYTDGLQKAINTITSIGSPAGTSNVIFLSDGVPTTGQAGVAQANTIKTTMGQNLRAFGVGTGATLPPLQALDPSAIIFTSTTQLISVFDGTGPTGGGSDSETTSVIVNNVAAAVDNQTLTPSTINENGSTTISGDIVDPGTLDTHTLVIDWGDGSADTTLNLAAGVATFSSSHQYLDDGASPGNNTLSDTYTIGVTVTDDDGGNGSTLGGGSALVVNQTDNANTLANALGGSGITILTANYNGGSEAAGTFTGGMAAGIGIGAGIILTSGDVNTAPGPNLDDAATGTNNLPGDPQLDALIPGFSTLDATSLTLTFTSASSSVFFNYVFASEEYNEFVNSPYNDVFGFFLDGSNIALIPGTSTPVSINNVNGGNPLGVGASHPEFYNNNDLSDGTPAFNIQYDGFTNVFTASFTGLSPGTHTLKLAIADAGDQFLDSAVFLQAGSLSNVSNSTVTVNNVNPTITASGGTINENGTATVSGNITDPGTLDAHTVTINWADGSANTVLNLAAGTLNYSATHQYLDDGASPGNGTSSDAYSVGVTVTDDDTGSDSATADVVVKNLNPTINATGDTIDEDGSASVSGNITDPGTLDAHTVTIDWADGSSPTVINLPAGTLSYSSTHQYLDDGVSPGDGTSSNTYAVSVDVTDDDGGAGSASADVVVNNVAPTVAAFSAVTIDEDGSASIGGSYDDVGTLDLHTMEIDWGDGTTSAASVDTTARTWSASHQYLDDGSSPGNGTTFDDYTVTATVTDDDGTSGSNSATITVNNVGPELSVSGPVSGVRGQELFYSGSFTDPGTLDEWNATVDFGSGPQALTLNPDKSFNFSHIFTATGSYSISVQIQDDDGGFDTEVFGVVIKIVDIQVDPCDPSKTALFVGGTTANDKISLSSAGGGTGVHMNSVNLGTFFFTGQVIIYAQAGNDSVNVGNNVDCMVFGSAGNDSLNGGSGHDILLGGEGNDRLDGGSGCDVLIGGVGMDSIVGAGHDDLMVAGFTVYDWATTPTPHEVINFEGICNIHEEWCRTDIDPNQRRDHLLGVTPGGLNGSTLLNNTTVFDDAARDTVHGSGGIEWAFFNYAGGGVLDLQQDNIELKTDV